MAKRNSPNQTVAHQIAVEIIDDNPELAGAAGTDALIAQRVSSDFSQIIWKKIRRLRPSTLGVIAASGKGCRVAGDCTYLEISPRAGTDLYYVHCEQWLGKYWDGLSLLREIARTAIIAEMADILTARQRRQPVEVTTAAA